MTKGNVVDIAASKPSASVVVVTPEIAARWIAKNLRNRNIRKAVVNAYARDMKSGNWQLTGEAVKFDRNGDLIDGQHRLMAIIQSEQSVPLFVVRGLSPNAQDVMDSGSKRQASDALHLSGYRNAHIVAAAARLELSLTGDTVGGRTFTNSEIAEWVTGNPGIEDAAAASMNLRTIDLSPSVITVAWHRLSQIDPLDCAEFWASLANNATNGAGDPRNTLLKRVASARRSGERLAQTVQLNFVIRAWNAWRGGRELHVLRDRASNGKGSSTTVSIPKAV